MASELNSDQLEIVELLCGELAEALATDNSALSVPGTERHALLAEYSGQCEQFNKAMELAGLTGLSLFCHHLTNNFTALAELGSAFDETLIDSISAWPMTLLNFLHQFIDADSDEASLQIATEELIAYASQEVWPQPLNDNELSELQEALAHSQIVPEENANTAQLILDADSIALSISDDIRPELLQGLLAELPDQSRAFEQSINAFLRQSRLELLLPAQRVAHTIKGAANIVGIRGLANLMHVSEDLLEDITKGHVANEKLQSITFNDLLIDIADCLGDITDFLIGTGPQPTNLLSVLQALIQFRSGTEATNVEQLTVETNIAAEASEISVNNEKSITDSVDVHSQVDANLETAAQENTPDESFSASLSLSQHNAQQLLRIAGESQIANTQFMAQLDAMKTSIDQTERFHRRIKSMAMELEALLQTQNALRSAMYRSRADEHANNDSDFDPLEMESYSELHSFSNQLLELTADSYEAVSHIEEQIDSLSALTYTQRQLNRDNNDLLLRTHMVAVDSIVPRLQRCVRQACRLTQKNAVLDVIGETLQIDNRVLSGIVDPLMHLLRNAVDHGIETDADRLAAGKDATGIITVEFVQQGEIIHIHCRDDGRGLDFETIRNKALSQQLLNEQDEIDEIGLSRLLFLPGFSTRNVVSQTSGRGIGLDIVQEEVKKLKGTVHLTNNQNTNNQSTNNQSNNSENGGCCFTLSVPASILTAHTLLISLQHSVVSVLSRGIDNIVHIDPSQVQDNSGSLTFVYQEVEIPVFHLADLTGHSTVESNSINALLIITRADGSQLAIGVEKLLASQDLVIKPLNQFTYHPPGVVGATILGDGTVSAVVDINALPGLNMSREEFARLQAQRSAMAALDKAQQWQLPTALIIDDSLSARQSLSQFVSELGMQVRTAKDGFEAISVMEEKRPNVILVDLEMPRMNGLEFTAHLRADESTRDIPVIMITSRSTDKHRQLAQKAGVDDYLNKPWSDEDLLTSIQQAMHKNTNTAIV